MDKFEITAEQQDLHQTKLWFDNLIITNLDTARVHENLVFEDVTSLEDQGLLNDIVKFFPNPVEDILHIEMNGNFPFSYILFDLTGKIMLSDRAVKKVNIDVSDYQSGIYFIKLMRKENVLHSVKIFKRYD